MSESSEKKNDQNPFVSLTWLDLESWVGTKILSRGKSYQRAGYVRDLCITKDGDLVAWVEGTSLYTTKVTFNGKKLSSSCTCPYGFTCKHAVAVVLEYLKALKEGNSLPEVDEYDKRLLLIKNSGTDSTEEDNDEYGDFEGNDISKEEKVFEKNSSHKHKNELEDFLRKKTQQELVEILIQIADCHPEIDHELKYNSHISTGSVATILKTLSREIDLASSEPGWQDHWRNNGYTPDYSRVKSGLQKLLDSGHSDEVVNLGEKLFHKGIDQINQTNDDGETASEIADALSIVFKALRICSKPNVEQMEWAIDLELADDYGLCDELEEFWKKKFEKGDWSALADRLLHRLKEMREESRDRSFHTTYLRDKLTDKIIQALQNAGREEEILLLCEKEAKNTSSYVRLVKYLRKAGRTEEAEDWIRKGIAATERKLPGIASSLRNELLDIRSRKRDWSFVAAIRADEFFERPSLEAFKNLQKTAEKAGVWMEVRSAVINYLIKGKGPRHSDRGWPLPDTELTKLNDYREQKPPFTKELIDISIYEKNIDEVLHWYEIYSKKNTPLWGWSWEENIDSKVADAIMYKYPERSIEIWKKIAENYIALKNPKWYLTAAQFLRKVQKTMKSNGKDTEWKRYLETLRAEHARKRRFIEILDSMTGKPIIDS